MRRRRITKGHVRKVIRKYKEDWEKIEGIISIKSSKIRYRGSDAYIFIGTNRDPKDIGKQIGKTVDRVRVVCKHTYLKRLT